MANIVAISMDSKLHKLGETYLWIHKALVYSAHVFSDEVEMDDSKLDEYIEKMNLDKDEISNVAGRSIEVDVDKEAPVAFVCQAKDGDTSESAFSAGDFESLLVRSLEGILQEHGDPVAKQPLILLSNKKSLVDKFNTLVSIGERIEPESIDKLKGLEETCLKLTDTGDFDKKEVCSTVDFFISTHGTYFDAKAYALDYDNAVVTSMLEHLNNIYGLAGFPDADTLNHPEELREALVQLSGDIQGIKLTEDDKNKLIEGNRKFFSEILTYPPVGEALVENTTKKTVMYAAGIQ